MELAIARSKDIISQFDINMIPKKWDMDKFMYYVEGTGIAWVDYNKEGIQLNPQHQSVLDMSIKTIGQYITLLESILNEWEKISGVSRQRQGTIGAYEGKASSQQAILQSSHITEDLFRKFARLEQRDLQALLDYSKEAWLIGKQGMFVMPDGTTDFLDLDTLQHMESNYGIFVSDAGKDQQRLDQIKGLAQAMIQNGTKASMVAEMFESENFSQIKGKLKAAEKAAEAIPEPEEVVQQAKQNPGGTDELLRQILALLQKADKAVELPGGMEQKVDQAVDGLEDAAGKLDAEAPAGSPEAQAAGGEGEASAPTVSVFRGKGGKGLQSFLDRSKSGVPGKVYGAILKHVANNLKAQGVTVTESVLDDVQGWMWYGLVEDAYRAEHGEAALQTVLSEGLPGEDEQKAKMDTGPEGGAEPVIQIYKGKKGKGLQSWMDINKGKLGIDDTAVKVLLMTVEDWAKANGLKVENMSHDMLGKLIPEVVRKHRVKKLQEKINKLK